MDDEVRRAIARLEAACLAAGRVGGWHDVRTGRPDVADLALEEVEAGLVTGEALVEVARVDLLVLLEERSGGW